MLDGYLVSTDAAGTFRGRVRFLTNQRRTVMKHLALIVVAATCALAGGCVSYSSTTRTAPAPTQATVYTDTAPTTTTRTVYVAP